jgi:vancomycin permeability regulator SanA
MRFIPNWLHRGPWRRLPDVDVLQSLVVAAFACVASAGLLWVGYAAWAWLIAARAPTHPREARTLLLFGKRLVNGQVDRDFLARIARAHEVVSGHGCERIVLLGGSSSAAGVSEATAALRELRRLGMPAGVEVLIDEASLDTLENLRNARSLLGVHARAPVALLSSRYHLPRCAFLARRLGLDYELCAAEDVFESNAAQIWRIALESGYIFWIDIGTRWAKLTGQRRVVEQIS